MNRWRAHLGWAALLSAAFLVRTAIDWFQPAADFHLRSSLSTVVSALIFVSAAAAAAWRSGSWTDGPISALITGLLAAGMSTTGVALLYAVRHDPATLQAIAGSGGLDEALLLPLLITMPGVILGVMGGICGALARMTGGRFAAR